MKAFKCDRCKHLETGEPIVIILHAKWESPDRWLQYYTGDRVELCKRCFRTLKRFIKNKPRVLWEGQFGRDPNNPFPLKKEQKD
jgi:hypothetical protein